MSIRARRIGDFLATALFSAVCCAIFLFLAVLLWFVASRGWRAITPEFILEPPREGMTAGGIWTPLVGTFQLVVVSMAAVIPIGIATGLYFSEYATEGTFTNLLRLAIRSLAGVPSIVYGLFGLTFFVIFLHLGPCLLSAGLTLACVALPLIVTGAEGAFRSVPQDLRDASYALGATKWQTIYKVVIPSASSTLITTTILSIGRVAGETAPILFTGATFYAHVSGFDLFGEIMALPTHIYVLATAGTQIEQTRPLQYGAVLVLLALVLGFCLIGIAARARIAKKTGL